MELLDTLIQATTLLLVSALASAACYFLTDLLVDKTGPFSVFERVRQLVGINVPVVIEDGEVEMQSNGRFWAEVLSCPYCTTPYVAFWVSLLFIPFGASLFNLLIIWLAACGIVYRLLDTR